MTGIPCCMVVPFKPNCVCHSLRVYHAPCVQVWSLWGNCHWRPLWEMNGDREGQKRQNRCLSPAGSDRRRGGRCRCSDGIYLTQVFLLIWYCCQQLSLISSHYSSARPCAKQTQTSKQTVISTQHIYVVQNSYIVNIQRRAFSFS